MSLKSLIPSLVLFAIFPSLLPFGMGAPASTWPLPMLSFFTRDRPPCMDEQYRTVWTLVQNCLKVVFACSWTVIHVNVPGPNCHGIMRQVKKLEAMFYTILVPEAVFLWAFRQYKGAQKLAKIYNEELGLGPTPSFRKALGNYFSASIEPMNRGWTITHGFYVEMGGFALYKGDELVCVLSCEDLIQLIQNGDVEPPRISEDEIMDKSKGSLFTIIFTVGEILAFIIYFIRRMARGLGCAHLELGTLCICIMTFLIPMIWFKKPLDVEVPTPVRLIRKSKLTKCTTEEGQEVEGHDGSDSEGGQSRGDYSSVVTTLMTKAQVVGQPCRWTQIKAVYAGFKNAGWTEKLILVGKLLFHPVWTIIQSVKELLDCVGQGSRQSQFSAAPVYDEGFNLKVTFPLFGLAGAAFSGGHLFAWNQFFPTPAEQWIWRIAGVVTAAVPLLFGVLSPMSQIFRKKDGEKRLFAFVIRLLVDGVGMPSLQLVLVPLYVLARLMIVLLMFTTLRNLPIDVLKDL